MCNRTGDNTHNQKTWVKFLELHLKKPKNYVEAYVIEQSQFCLGFFPCSHLSLTR